jgi:transcriptional regulator with XRE-family HTH domain
MGQEHTLRLVFQHRLRERRLLMKMTQSQLAKKIGVHGSTISFWETGDRNRPTLLELMSLAQALHCSVDWLLGMPEVTEPPPPTLKRAVARRLVEGLIELQNFLVEMLPGEGEAWAESDPEPQPREHEPSPPQLPPPQPERPSEHVHARPPRPAQRPRLVKTRGTKEDEP